MVELGAASIRPKASRMIGELNEPSKKHIQHLLRANLLLFFIRFGQQLSAEPKQEPSGGGGNRAQLGTSTRPSRSRSGRLYFGTTISGCRYRGETGEETLAGVSHRALDNRYSHGMRAPRVWRLAILSRAGSLDPQGKTVGKVRFTGIYVYHGRRPLAVTGHSLPSESAT